MAKRTDATIQRNDAIIKRNVFKFNDIKNTQSISLIQATHDAIYAIILQTLQLI